MKPEKIFEARRCLEQGKNDEAIDLLRSEEAPHHAEACVLLARAYYQRGDTRGDIYSSHFFAQRALSLGLQTDEVLAMYAVTSFQKEQYTEAVFAFEQFVTADSPAGTMLLFGLALVYSGREMEGKLWIEKASQKDPACQEKAKEGVLFSQKEKTLKISSTGNMYESRLEQLKFSEQAEIPALYEHQPLSMLRGQGESLKDFDWMDKNVPCQKACPAGTDIPEYLNAIFLKEYDRAYRINLWDNVFPGVLGRVCARPCEEKCRHGWPGLGQPVAICWSKRAAADHRSSETGRLKALFSSSGKSVAVIGAGVAGLAAARQLALCGHAVTVYEKHKIPGGMMNQGIPEFRLPREVIQREIEQVLACGVRLECGKDIGKDILFEDFVKSHEAVIVAAGTLRPNKLELPGAEISGIYHGLEFLLSVNEYGRRDIGKNVIVIGGGFTAMDCARTAWRLGAKSVRVLYRRSVEEMLITPGELEELSQEGIPMEFLIGPVAYLGQAGQGLSAVRFIRNELGAPDQSGRRRPVPIQGSEFNVEADMVLLATGQFADTSWIGGPLSDKICDSSGRVLGTGGCRTNIENVFLAGDFAQGASSLISAIAHAKQTAREVDRFLTGKERFKDVVRVQDAQTTGRIREMDAVPRVDMPVITTDQRDLRAEVEKGLDPALAIDETQRCYLCHYKFEIDQDKCIYCDWCIKAKPRPNCILKVKEIIRDEEGRTKDFVFAKSSEETKFIYINQEDCIRCHACVLACPVGCIHVQKVSLQTKVCDGSQKGKSAGSNSCGSCGSR